VTQQYPPASPFQPSGPYLPPGPPPGPPQRRPGPPQVISYPTPARFETVTGTGFGVAFLRVPSGPSGLAIGALLTGVGAIGVSLAVWAFGLIGARSGNGGLIGGAFALLTGALGVAGLVLGWLGRRQISRSAGEFTGRGMALSGMICAGVGLALGAGGELVAILTSLG
jgi:hypothetical protein